MKVIDLFKKHHPEMGAMIASELKKARVDLFEVRLELESAESRELTLKKRIRRLQKEEGENKIT